MQNSQLRSLALAIAGSIMAASATMFVPTSVLESITGSTGLSEMVPATAAPLGDTARALIAFGTGALVLAVLVIFLMRGDRQVQQRTSMPKFAPAPVTIPADITDDYSEERLSLVDRIRGMPIPKFAFPKMPWVKNEGDITELSDLPRLRGGDAHPDAPARRPLIASQDLPEYGLPLHVGAPPVDEELPVLKDTTAEKETAHVIEETAIAADPDAGFAPTQTVMAELESRMGTGDIPDAGYQPTLAEMVSQLESSVAQRQKQLDALEVVATRLSEDVAGATVDENPGAQILPPLHERRTLEAVPPSRAADDDMDAALSAALETLYRMNATAR